MYRLKYYSLSKKEQIQLKEDFYQTELGQSLDKRLKRLLVIGILSILFSIYLFISHNNIWDIITGIMLLIAALVFIIASFKIRIQKLNAYLVKKSKK